MISQLAGAVVRAILIVIVISTPSLLIPGTSSETTQVVTLVSIFAAFFTYSEYAASYPGLIEFRDAPPFNRVRVISMFITLFLLSIAVSTGDSISTFSLVVHATGMVVAHALDMAYSPINLLIAMLPPDTSAGEIATVRIMGGLSFLVGLVFLTIFAILLRVNGWPNRRISFNVWINLPTFDPTIGGDVVARLRRDARVNIILGVFLPFIIPMMVGVGIDYLGLSILASKHTLVWTITLWSFLPVSLFMRGMAMGRVADMIAARRKRLVEDLGEGVGALPA